MAGLITKSGSVRYSSNFHEVARWAREDPNFFGWFGFGGPTLEEMRSCAGTLRGLPPPFYQEKLSRAIHAIRSGTRSPDQFDAAEVFEWAWLRDADWESRSVVRQGVYFPGDVLELDRTQMESGGHPDDYRVPQAPEFFRRVGRKRTRKIFEGSPLDDSENADFKAVKAWHLWSEGCAGMNVQVCRIKASRGQLILGVITSSGGGFDYEEEFGPLFADWSDVEEWARELPNFIGWFPFGALTLGKARAVARKWR